MRADPARRGAGAVEWRTLLLAFVIHAGWLALTWWHALLPGWALAAAGGWIVAWHGSLQHETIHGHPTGDARLNGLIGGVPLSLWLPYAVYRRSHVAHHATPNITDPFDDTESRYLPARNGIALALARVEGSLTGRLLIGPALAIGRFLTAEARRGIVAPGPVARDWLPHLAAVAGVIGWLHLCGLPPARYILCFVYPGIALTLLRSFAEHRAAAEPGHRVALVESRGPLALLYLNNNLHAAHHRAPGIAWYDLPAYHRRHRADLLRENGGLVYPGYRAIVRRFARTMHDGAIHPDYA